MPPAQSKLQLEPEAQATFGEPASQREVPREPYSTGAVYLLARDPHWVYAHWDLRPERQREYNLASVDHHLVLRVALEDDQAHPVSEVHLHPESQYWFVHVPRAGVRYVAQLGYYRFDRLWVLVGTSGPTETPPDAVAEDRTIRFAEVPSVVPAAELPRSEAPAEKLEASQFLRVSEIPLERPAARNFSRDDQAASAAFEGRPSPIATTAHAPEAPARPAQHIPVVDFSGPGMAELTEAQEEALFRLVVTQRLRKQAPNSAEFLEEILRVEEEISSRAVARRKGQPEFRPAEEITSPTGAEFGEVTSPGAFRGVGRAGFWFNINAELIVYGATEPDARVEIGGRRIRLRPDGTFSYRFALPDGHYQLAALAISRDELESRYARLDFSRTTEYRGDVGVHPQDPALKPPSAENVA